MALIGCGGMGLRHVYGMIQLKKHFDTFNLVALCDRNKSAAEHVSAIAEKELGIRPQIFTEFDDLLASNASVPSAPNAAAAMPLLPAESEAPAAVAAEA